MIAGVAGLLPDIDVAAFWILHWFGFSLSELHRTFTHNIFIPLILLGLFVLFRKKNFAGLGRHKLKLSIVFLMVAFGITTHLILDAIFMGEIMPFYPFSIFSIGFNIVSLFPEPLDSIFLPSLDAILLFFWLIYLEWKHKISDFI